DTFFESGIGTGNGRSASITAFDYDDNGRDEFLVPDENGEVTVYNWNGEGFNTPEAFPAGKGTNAVAIGDFDGNGTSDIAISNLSDDDVTVIRHAGGTTYGTPFNVTVGDAPIALTTGYLNQDSLADIVVANRGSSDVTVLLAVVGAQQALSFTKATVKL